MSLESRSSEPERFGEFLRRLRLARNLTQEALAERARISIEAVSALERGFRRAPQRQTLELLATALELGVDEAHTLAALALVAPQPRRRTETTATAAAEAATLIGRERDLEVLRSTIAPGRIVTIAGPGGIGKTTVARALVASDRNAAFVTLASVVAGGVVAAVAAAFGITADFGARGIDSVLDALRAGGSPPGTVVLDNCEHVISEARDAAQELALRGGLAIIVTSREPLGAGVESIHRLSPLGFPSANAEIVKTADAFAYPAVRLFARRASEASSDYDIGDDEAPIVAEICRRLDGNALAIELAARRVRVLPPRELRRRLDGRLRLLATSAPYVEPRHRTLHALVGWSFDLLRDDERAFLIALGIFGGPFALEAAAAVATPDGDEVTALDLLDALMAKSLVAPVPGDVHRYGLLETIGIFARAELEKDPRREIVARRFVGYFGDLASSCLRSFEGDPRRALVDQLVNDAPNVAAAFDGAISLRDAETATALTRIRELSASNEETLGSAWERVLQIVPPERPDLIAALWLVRAVRSASRSSAEASDHARTALTWARTSGNVDLIGWALSQLASSAAIARRLDESDLALGELETLARSALTQKRSLHARAMVATYRDRRSVAAALFRELAVLEAGYGNRAGECVALINLAEADFARGDAAAAVDTALRARSLETFVQLPVRQGLRANLAGYYLACGEYERARAIALEALQSKSGEATDVPLFAHAALAVARADAANAVRAAHLWGYALAEAKRLSVTGDYTERVTERALREELGARLEPEALDRHLRFGGLLTFEEARAIVAEP